MINYDGNPANYAPHVGLIQDSDPPNASFFNPGMENLADRTAYLKSKVDTINSAVDATYALVYSSSFISQSNTNTTTIHTFTGTTGAFVTANKTAIVTSAAVPIVGDIVETAFHFTWEEQATPASSAWFRLEDRQNGVTAGTPSSAYMVRMPGDIASGVIIGSGSLFGSQVISAAGPYDLYLNGVMDSNGLNLIWLGTYSYSVKVYRNLTL